MIKLKAIILYCTILSIIFFGLGIIVDPNLPIDSTTEKTDPIFLDLFIHNLQACMLAIVFGIFTFGLFGLFYLFINFFTMGIIVFSLSSSHSLFDILSTFIYHGVFEIPAMILSTSIGIYLPLLIVRSIRKKLWMKKSFYSVSILFSVVILFTIFAALIETYITPKLMII